MDGARGVEYYISKPRWSSGKIYAPGSLICIGKFRGVFCVYFVGRISEVAMGGPRSSFRGGVAHKCAA
jgi:hypothetical protein